MNENKENKPVRKKAEQSGDNNQPVKVIRYGAIAASIWKRQAQGGYAYYDFTLSRSWISKNGEKKGYSQNFFETNCDALVRCVQEASAWIEENKSAETSEVAQEPIAA